VTPDEFTQLRRLISTRLSDYLVGVFRALGSWRDPDADRFIAIAVPLVQGSQQTLAQLVSLYIADQASRATGAAVAVPLIPASAISGLRGVDSSVVYRRPFVTAWTRLSKGDDLPTAVERGARRLHQVVEGDMQQTHSSAARAAMQALPGKPTGWRRVLVGEESCELCVAASTRTYGVEHLNPLHPECDCRVEPVFGTAAVKNSDPSGYVMHHGELGPLLVRPQDSHVTPADLPA
jgi:hypothetical protein